MQLDLLDGSNQRENRLRDSLGKFIALHKARFMYMYPECCYSFLVGLRVVFQILMPEDSGSNPEAGNIYFS